MKYFCITKDESGKSAQTTRNSIEEAIALCHKRSVVTGNVYAAVGKLNEDTEKIDILWTPKDGFIK